jgi:hypothetical protein
MILNTLYLVDAKNTNSWRTRNGGLQRAFALDVPMVPSSALVITTDAERLSCGGFSLGETIHFGSLEFIADHFGGLCLSPMGDGSEIDSMGSARGRPPSPRQAMIWDPTEGSSTASDREGRINLPPPKRHGTGLSPPQPQPHHGRRTL